MPSAASTAIPPYDLPAARDLAEPLLSAPKRRISAIVGIALGSSVIVSVLLKSQHLGLQGLTAAIPTTPIFWLLLLAAYLVGPVGDWLILRRLWGIPVAGLLPLLGKQAANELVFGYSGDAQFYLWARENVRPPHAPFATLRDLSILSALAGNAATLLLMVGTYPLMRAVASDALARAAFVAVAVIVLTSTGVFIAQRIFFSFSFSRRVIAEVFAAQFARVAVGLIIGALLWLTVVPGITLGTLLVLTTLRTMLSRVPFVPSKDALFAGVGLFLMHNDAALVQAVALVAALTFGTQAVLGVMAMAANTARGWQA